MKGLKKLLWILLIIEVGVYYWFKLPPFSIWSNSFWFFVLQTLFLAWLISLLIGDGVGVKTEQVYTARRRIIETQKVEVKSLTKRHKLSGLAIVSGFVLLIVLSFMNSPLFRAKDYANVISVTDASFKEDFKETDISSLALLDRASAEKIGDTYLGTIDKVSQFGISDDYRQITIGKQPFRVSPLEYKSFWKWLTNHRDGIDYYVKVNQTTGKAELVKLKKAMHYSDSEYFLNDTARYLRLKYPTTIFGKPSFEVDDEGNPYYIATEYLPKFGLSSKDPVGVVVLDAVTGKTRHYQLDEVPTWVDRVYSANNVVTRLDDHYTYQKGFWNTLFSQAGVKETTESYNYLAVGSDIYLYTGLTSATADSSNLGFLLVNMRTREVTNYKLASATETAAQASAEGEVQEKGYRATAPTLVKLKDKAYYLVSLKDDAGLVKTYALVDAEDYQQVLVANDISSLLMQATGGDYIPSSDYVGTADKKSAMVSGKVEALASQMISGSTVYYIQSNGEIYKVKASEDTTDDLPFISVGDQFTGQLSKHNYLKQFIIVKEN